MFKLWSVDYMPKIFVINFNCIFPVISFMSCVPFWFRIFNFLVIAMYIVAPARMHISRRNLS